MLAIALKRDLASAALAGVKPDTRKLERSQRVVIRNDWRERNGEAVETTSSPIDREAS
jgi:hypothetical protein